MDEGLHSFFKKAVMEAPAFMQNLPEHQIDDPTVSRRSARFLLFLENGGEAPAFLQRGGTCFLAAFLRAANGLADSPLQSARCRLRLGTAEKG